MARTKAIKFNEFMTGDYKKRENLEALSKVAKGVAPAFILIVPKSILAAGVDSTFGNVHDAIMRAFDAGIVLVIIFAGAAWALGHRSKAIEILLGVCCGYVLARHAVDIRDFLKGI